MTNPELIRSQIKSIEAQLRVLEARIQSSSEQPTLPEHSFADLYGCLRDQVQSGEEDIDAVLYRLPVDSED